MSCDVCLLEIARSNYALRMLDLVQRHFDTIQKTILHDLAEMHIAIQSAHLSDGDGGMLSAEAGAVANAMHELACRDVS